MPAGNYLNRTYAQLSVYCIYRIYYVLDCHVHGFGDHRCGACWNSNDRRCIRRQYCKKSPRITFRLHRLWSLQRGLSFQASQIDLRASAELSIGFIVKDRTKDLMASPPHNWAIRHRTRSSVGSNKSTNQFVLNLIKVQQHQIVYINFQVTFDSNYPEWIWQLEGHSVLGRAHLSPTKVFRRLSE